MKPFWQIKSKSEPQEVVLPDGTRFYFGAGFPMDSIDATIAISLDTMPIAEDDGEADHV